MSMGHYSLLISILYSEMLLWIVNLGLKEIPIRNK